MEKMNCKERLHRVLSGEAVDRPPCICPGGMMNMITQDLMRECGLFLPEAHTDATAMAGLAKAVLNQGCFENYGVPFCMTVEAEEMGSEVDLGSDVYEPHVTGYAIQSAEEWTSLSPVSLEEGRSRIVLDAIRILKVDASSKVPIIGNLTGPISTAGSVLEPTTLYREMRRNPDAAHRLLQFVTEQLIRFARAQAEAGADVIAISDPSGTGEILGPKLFEQYAVRYLNQLLEGISDIAGGTIVHICGQMKQVYEQVDLIRSQALSFDSVVPMREARAHLNRRTLMGNVSTYALEFAAPEKVGQLARGCIKNGADILSPACGLGMRSPIANIQAMCRSVQEKIDD